MKASANFSAVRNLLTRRPHLLPSLRQRKPAPPEEQIEAAYQAVQSALRPDLLERIVQNTTAFFEQLIVDLLIAMSIDALRSCTIQNRTGLQTTGVKSAELLLLE